MIVAHVGVVEVGDELADDEEQQDQCRPGRTSPSPWP